MVLARSRAAAQRQHPARSSAKKTSRRAENKPQQGHRAELIVASASHRYHTLLETKGSYMTSAPPGGLVTASKAICQSPLDMPQPVPADTLFRDDIFKAAGQKLDFKSEVRIIRDITPLIVPSAPLHVRYQPPRSTLSRALTRGGPTLSPSPMAPLRWQAQICVSSSASSSAACPSECQPKSNSTSPSIASTAASSPRNGLLLFPRKDVEKRELLNNVLGLRQTSI